MRVFLILLTTILFSCKSNEATTSNEVITKVEVKSTPVIFAELNAGTNGGFTKKSDQILTDQNAYNEVWFKAFEKFSNKQRPAKIDFENKTIILVAMGIQNSGGHTIKVGTVMENQKNIIVNVIESKPGSSCMTTSVMTFPYQIIEIPKGKIDKEIIFKSKVEIYECEK